MRIDEDAIETIVFLITVFLFVSVAMSFAVNGTGTNYSIARFGLAADGDTEATASHSLRTRMDQTPAYNIAYDQTYDLQAHVGFFDRLIFVAPVIPVPPAAQPSYHRTVDTSLLDQAGIGYIALVILSMAILLWRRPKEKEPPKDNKPAEYEIDYTKLEGGMDYE